MEKLEKKTLENNKLIAEFMELEFTSRMSLGEEYHGFIIPWDKNRLYAPKYLEYHESWDWLMPVVDKCTQIGFRDTEFDDEVYQKWEEIFDDTGMFLGNHIEEVYNAVVEFIKWYNNEDSN